MTPHNVLHQYIAGVSDVTLGRQHWTAWPSVSLGWNFPSSRTRPTLCLFLLLHWWFAWPGCGRVGLHSVGPFHCKLLHWSWLRWHWHADWLLWRSVLMRRLIMLPLPAGIQLTVVGFPAFLKLERASVRQWILNSSGTMDGNYRCWHPHPCTPATHIPSHCAKRVS